MNPFVRVAGAVGRGTILLYRALRDFLHHVSNLCRLFGSTLWFLTVGAAQGRTRMGKQIFPMMRNVGVRSLPVVALITFLTGAILVLQTGDVMKKYGQLQQVPGMVALSVVRALGPLMTAIIMTARVGASFTAVLGSMRINEEIMALEAMAIHPTGYLVAPRLLSMLVMVPCLAVFSYLLGMAGGWLVALAVYDIDTDSYIQTSILYLDMTAIVFGLVKSVVFAVLITMICCYYGLIAEGGPMGLGRNIMVAVVVSIVMLVVAEALLAAVMVNWLLSK
ncbi:MAG: ABC transporter permease [Planctomycetes bacterium]|nr:ABC transporter permease [Planctomycetota bacterium]